MSGGHFDYEQYKISMIADEIQHVIERNHEKNEYGWSHDFSEETIQEFKNAVKCLRQAQIYAQRIDWLISGDDGEDNFHKRLQHELNELLLDNQRSM